MYLFLYYNITVFFFFLERKKVLERCGIPDKPICLLGINRQAVFTNFLELFHIHSCALFEFIQKATKACFGAKDDQFGQISS